MYPERCEFCQKALDDKSEWGDVDGAIACADCLGWTGKPKDQLDPDIQRFYKKHGEFEEEEPYPDKVPLWPPTTEWDEDIHGPRPGFASRESRLAKQLLAGVLDDEEVWEEDPPENLYFVNISQAARQSLMKTLRNMDVDIEGSGYSDGSTSWTAVVHSPTLNQDQLEQEIRSRMNWQNWLQVEPYHQGKETSGY